MSVTIAFPVASKPVQLRRHKFAASGRVGSNEGVHQLIGVIRKMGGNNRVVASAANRHFRSNTGNNHWVMTFDLHGVRGAIDKGTYSFTVYRWDASTNTFVFQAEVQNITFNNIRNKSAAVGAGLTRPERAYSAGIIEPSDPTLPISKYDFVSYGYIDGADTYLSEDDVTLFDATHVETADIVYLDPDGFWVAIFYEVSYLGSSTNTLTLRAEGNNGGLAEIPGLYFN